MLRSIPTAVLLAASSLALPSTVYAAPAAPVLQDDDPVEKPDKRPEVKELLAELKAHARERGDEDQEAIAVIDKLLAEFEESGLKDRASIAKGIADCLKEKRKESAEGIRDNKLYMAAAVALGEMGPESVKPIEGWIDHKSHRKDLDLQRRLILSLGKTKHEDAWKPLTDLLNHKDAIVQAAAAEALGNFDKFDQKVRKEVFSEILKVLMSVYASYELDPNDTIARERYDVIAAPMITTLQLVSGHDARKPADWQSWWNNNKKEDWDKVD